jgi:peptidoglycan/xylan/chitin deacetylase (PgdA/CDA1 family)
VRPVFLALPCVALALALVACASRDAPPPAPCPAVAPVAIEAAPSVPPSPSAFVPGRNADPIEVAITVDDLPRHGPDVPGVTRAAIHQRMLDAFAAHRVPAVTGFINAKSLEAHPEDGEALRAWVAAGHPLANHTYSHVDANTVPLAPYLADLEANEATLRRFMVGTHTADADGRAWKVFRFPYLREGKDLPARVELRREIEKRAYRLAPVTIDFYDWAYQPAHARCLAKNDEKAIAALREDYLDQASAALLWSDAAARELAGRPTKQVLLLHVGHFSSLMMDELLSLYEKRGARFITLDEALADPIVSGDVENAAIPFGTVFNQRRRARGTRSPVLPTPPDTLLDLVCR